MGYRAMKRKAISIANHSPEKIVLGVYQNLINNHNSFCSCDYCQILKQYVAEKKSLSRFKKRDYEYYYITPHELGGDFDTESNFYNQLEKRRLRIKELKAKKDELKKQVISSLKK